MTISTWLRLVLVRLAHEDWLYGGILANRKPNMTDTYSLVIVGSMVSQYLTPIQSTLGVNNQTCVDWMGVKSTRRLDRG